MKKLSKYLFILLIGLFSVTLKVEASSNSIYVNLESFEYKVNQNEYTNIKEYETLDAFLTDYNSNSLPEIYISNFLFDGVSSVKSPDLDDFIENDSNDIEVKTLELKVLNINTIGNVELTGETKGTMIAINTNNVKGSINLILNNVNLDTDSKKTPAIFVYNKETTYTDCKVTIEAKKDSKNYIEGGKFKKTSLVASDELDNYISYYSGDSLTNYQKYTSYYGVYNSTELNNILFATVKADSEDLQDGDPYIFYKGSGAISSDIDLYFEGEGYLKITSKNGEGIETKGNLTFSGGTGDYEIKSTDDRIVLAHSSGMAYLTFYFENNVIVRYETVAKYESAELAGYAYNALKSQEDKINVEKNGLYVITTENAEEYEHFTKDELIAAFAEAGYIINE